MSHPEKMLCPLPDGLTPWQRGVIAPYESWLAANGLQYRTAFKFGVVQGAVFQQGEQPRFFSFLFHQRVTFNAESYLEDLTILDTSNSGSLGLFPRPGAYAQSFPSISAQALWEKHLQGEAYLTEKFGFRWTPLHRSYEELVIPAMRVRMQHNRAQWCWPVRVLYRYFVTRHTIANRTMAQQFP